MKRAIAVYALAVVVVGGWMWLRHASTTQPSGKTQAPIWVLAKAKIKIPAAPNGIWTLALDHVKGPALIKIEAAGEWAYSPVASCGPNGDLGSLISRQNALLSGAPVGALLIKIGGSTAGIADGVVRVAGASAIVQIDDKTSGPVFLTINDELTGLSDNHGELEVSLFTGQLR